MRRKGKIVHWNGAKAFGFIEPSDGSKQVFVHISAFNSKTKSPSLGQAVSFQLAKDKQGRICAGEVLLAGEKATPARGRQGRSVLLIIVPVYFVILMASTAVTDLPVIVLGWQLALSLLTFLIYAWDKSAAKNNRWRTQEGTLHLIALFGGWPGAFLAQQFLRHKSKKESFQLVFWITVLISMAGVVWLHSDQGRVLLNGLVR